MLFVAIVDYESKGMLSANQNYYVIADNKHDALIKIADKFQATERDITRISINEITSDYVIK